MAKFMKVNEVPGVSTKKRMNLYKDWQEFMAMNIKIAQVDLKCYNYKSTLVAGQVMKKSVQRFGMPIDIFKRGEEIYLVRRDL